MTSGRGPGTVLGLIITPQEAWFWDSPRYKWTAETKASGKHEIYWTFAYLAGNQAYRLRYLGPLEDVQIRKSEAVRTSISILSRSGASDRRYGTDTRVRQVRKERKP
jgi:hypothetical protein